MNRRWLVLPTTPFAGLPVILLFSMIGLVFFLTSCEQGDDRWDEIAASGVLHVGLDPTYPPFELANGDEVTGLDVDLARALAAKLGLEPRFSYFGYDGLYDALTTGQVDVLISALIVAPERTRDIAYTPAYFDAGQFLVVPIDESDLTGMADFNGRSLAVELGARGHVIALEWQRRLPTLKIQTYESAIAALDAVALGVADGGLVDHVSARLYGQHAPEGARVLKRLPDPVATEPYAIAVRIGDETLLEGLTAGLATMQTNGELESIIARWLDP